MSWSQLVCLITFSCALGALGGCYEDRCASGCSAEERCVGGRCVARCVSDVDCPSGYLCFEGFCEEGSRRPGVGGGDHFGGDSSGGDATQSGDSSTLGDAVQRGDTQVSLICGDGVRGVDELCDGADLGVATSCASLGYGGTTIGCLPSCQHYDLSACTTTSGACNGSKAQGGEQCDGTDLRNATCETLGFSGGSLLCSSHCTFEFSGCN